MSAPDRERPDAHVPSINSDFMTAVYWGSCSCGWRGPTHASVDFVNPSAAANRDREGALADAYEHVRGAQAEPSTAPESDSNG